MKIKVAAVQMNATENFPENLKAAECYIKEAIEKGARLILLPEFGLMNYGLTLQIRVKAEPLKGITYQWLKKLCTEYGVYIGTCVLEREEDDFYDTFVLVGPNENELWTHRKIEPAGSESCLFKGAGLKSNPNVFDTPLGKIGIVICFDTAKSQTAESLETLGAEILLISCAYPELPSMLPGAQKDSWREIFQDAPTSYARFLGIPVVLSNKCGRFSSRVEGLPVGVETNFAGSSKIVDAKGNVISALDGKEGVLIEEIDIEPKVKRTDFNLKNRWFLPYTLFIRFMANASAKFAKRYYRRYKNKK